MASYAEELARKRAQAGGVNPDLRKLDIPALVQGTPVRPDYPYPQGKVNEPPSIAAPPTASPKAAPVTNGGIGKVTRMDLVDGTQAIRAVTPGATGPTTVYTTPQGAMMGEGFPGNRSQNSLGIPKESFGPTGSLSIVPAFNEEGARAEMDLANIRAAKAYKAGTGPLTKGAADLLGVTAKEKARYAANQAAPVASGPSWDEAMKDYASGRVGSEGYKMVRNLRVEQNADNFLRTARARNIAAGFPKRQREDVFRAALGGQASGTPQIPTGQDQAQQGGPDFGDYLDLARFGQDQREFAATQKQREIENDRAALEADEQRRMNQLEGMKAQNEMQQAFYEQAATSGVDPMLQQLAWAKSGGDPSVAIDKLNKIQREMGEEDFSEASPEAKKQMLQYLESML